MHVTSKRCLMKNVYLIFNLNQLGILAPTPLSYRMQISNRPITFFLPEGEGYLYGELVVNKSVISTYNLHSKYINELHILNLYVTFVRTVSKHYVGIVRP